MKFRFLMCPHRKNSVNDKVIGKKWIYLKRNAYHRESVGHLRKLRAAPGYGVVSFYNGG